MVDRWATLGRREKSALELSRFVYGEVGRSHVRLKPCPHAYPHTHSQPKQGPFPPAVYRRLHRYYEPLGLPPGTTPFHHRLIGAAASDVDRRGGSLLFRSELSLRAVLHTPGVSNARFRYGALSVAFAAT